MINPEEKEIESFSEKTIASSKEHMWCLAEWATYGSDLDMGDMGLVLNEIYKENSLSTLRHVLILRMMADVDGVIDILFKDAYKEVLKVIEDTMIAAYESEKSASKNLQIDKEYIYCAVTSIRDRINKEYGIRGENVSGINSYIVKVRRDLLIATSIGLFSSVKNGIFRNGFGKDCDNLANFSRENARSCSYIYFKNVAQVELGDWVADLVEGYVSNRINMESKIDDEYHRDFDSMIDRVKSIMSVK